MASESRLKGDDYQHLYSWFLVLELKIPAKKVYKVIVEDKQAGSVDDITIQHENDANLPDYYYQIKFHVDHRGEYSVDELIKHESDKICLLEKFWRTWKLLKNDEKNKLFELYLISNWYWDSTDQFKQCIDGLNNGIKEEFLSAIPNSKLGLLRKKWEEHLDENGIEFNEFIRSLRLKIAFDCRSEIEERISERMDNLGLKSDKLALIAGIFIIREWIELKKNQITQIELDAALKAYELYKPKGEEKSVTIYLTSIKSQKFDIDPDYLIDWRDYFIENQFKGGHQLKDPTLWNKQLLPELYHLNTLISEKTDFRFIRVRGKARLSAWFAFGFVFPEVDSFNIEVDQNERLWRTDAKINPSLDLLPYITEGLILNDEGTTVALGISVTGSIDNDVMKYLNEQTEKVAAVLFLKPNRELGKECLQCAGDVVSLADKVKKAASEFVKRWDATRLLLFYYGPLSGACFIGHRLNAVCKEIQIMEDQQPGYAPSFLLQQ